MKINKLFENSYQVDNSCEGEVMDNNCSKKMGKLIEEDYTLKPEVGKTYFFDKNGTVYQGEFVRATRSFNFFIVDGREVMTSIFATVATTREEVEQLTGMVDKMAKDTKVPNKFRQHNGKFFPVSEGLKDELTNRAKYHSKRQKGLSPFCSMGEGILEVLKDNEGENMKLEKLNEGNLTEDTVEKLYHSYKDIGKIVRFKDRHGNRWEIVDFIERHYNSYSEYKYRLKDIDMPGGTAVCDCEDVVLVTTPKEQPKVEEPKKDASHLIRKYLTPSAFADISNVVDASTPGNWHSDGAIVEFTYNGKTYYLDVQGGLTSARDKVWVREFRCKDTGEYYQDVSTYADNRGYKYGTLDLVKLITTGNWGNSNPKNTDDNRSSHLADSLDRTKLNEAIERGIKVYNVEEDGPPEVGRQIIAFVDSHEEYQIITRQDKDAINKKNWDNKDMHTSSDGEYYSGKNGWIYALDYTDYIYVDDLNLIPQRHHDKVAKEQQVAVERKQQLTDTLIKLYGNDLGQKFADKYITVKKDGRSVDILGYADYLIKPATYCAALSSFFETIERDFGADIAKQTLLTSPTLKLPHRTTKYKVHLGRGKQLNWNSYLHLGFSIDVDGNYFIFTQLHSKADTQELIDRLKRDGYLEKDVNYWSFTRNNTLEESATDLVEKKKKKKPYDSINKNAGNVEHNIAMFNKANSPIDSPCTNPVSGPMGGDACCESLNEEKLQEYYLADFSHIPEVKEIDFVGKPLPRVRGFNTDKFKSALDSVGLSEFKIRASRLNGVGLEDLRDEFGGRGMYPWEFSRVWDNSVKGFNEFYIFTKKDTPIEEGIEPMTQQEYEDALTKMATDHYRGFDILHSTWHIKHNGKEDTWDSYAFIFNGKMFPDEVYEGLDSLDKTKERIDQIINENPGRFGDVADTFNSVVKDENTPYTPKRKLEGLDDSFDMFMRGI